VTDEISNDRRKKLREWGRAGGLKGGPIGDKRRLITMTKAKRTVLAYEAGVQGGAPRKINHNQVRALGAAGLKYREMAAELNTSMPSVARILAQAGKKR
jgi:hypothetical protein